MDDMTFTSMGKEDMRRDGYGISQKKKQLEKGIFWGMPGNRSTLS